MSKKKENSFLMQGAILAATALITKIIGLAYRIPVTNIMGAEGNGYYGMVFQVYNLALMLTSYSLPTAVSKLVSARVATGQYRNAYRVFRGAMTFAIIAGGIVTAIVFFGAGFICFLKPFLKTQNKRIKNTRAASAPATVPNVAPAAA